MTPFELHAQSKFAGLAELLPKVATDDRTVIITAVNEAFARPGSLLGLFRESFYAGEKIAHLLDHLLVIAVDPAEYHHCRRVHPFCYLLQATTSMNLSSASNYMSDAYVELVWAKLELQQRVLQLGYNFLFTDVDILWFRDPFRHIGVHADMATSSDVYSGDPDDLSNWPNTGFYYVKSTGRTVEMLRRRGGGSRGATSRPSSTTSSTSSPPPTATCSSSSTRPASAASASCSATTWPRRAPCTPTAASAWGTS